MLVMTGTGMLGDFGILPTSLHYEILKWSAAAKLCRCKLLFVSVGVGPIRSRPSRILIKASLRLADYRSYRDDFSKQYLEGMNFDTKTRFCVPGLGIQSAKNDDPSGSPSAWTRNCCRRWHNDLPQSARFRRE